MAGLSIPKGHTVENLPWIFEGKGENLEELSGKGVLRLLAALSGSEKRLPRERVLKRCGFSELTLDTLIQAGWALSVGNDVILTERGTEMGLIAKAVKQGVVNAVRKNLRTDK